MRNGVVAVLLVVVIALSAGAGYFAGVANKQTTTMTTTTITTTTTGLLTSVQRFETPTPMSFSLNGQFDTMGMYCLSSPPGTVSMNLTAAYPWPLLTEPPPSITITYEFKPFPLNSTIPAWLSLSTIPEAIVMRQGQTATVSLVIAVNETTSNLGQEVFFHLWADYKDPASGSSVTNVIDFDFIVADTPSGSSPYQC